MLFPDWVVRRGVRSRWPPHGCWTGRDRPTAMGLDSVAPGNHSRGAIRHLPLRAGRAVVEKAGVLGRNQSNPGGFAESWLTAERYNGPNPNGLLICRDAVGKARWGGGGGGGRGHKFIVFVPTRADCALVKIHAPLKIVSCFLEAAGLVPWTDCRRVACIPEMGSSGPVAVKDDSLDRRGRARTPSAIPIERQVLVKNLVNHP